MGNTTESVDVEMDVTTAYNQWTQFESYPQFMDGVDEIKQLDDTHTHWKTSIGGVTREFDATITKQHPDERVAWKSDDGTSHAGVITFHRLGRQPDPGHRPDGHRTRRHRRNGRRQDWHHSRRVKGDMANFKKFIESRDGNETGAWRGDIA